MPLVNILARVKSFHRYMAKNPVTKRDTEMIAFELRSEDPEHKMRTIAFPLEGCPVRAGHLLRITVDLADEVSG